MKKGNSDYSRLVPESQKDASYHKRQYDQVINSGTLSTQIIGPVSKNYSFYLGLDAEDMKSVHRTVLVDNNGNPFPVYPINANAISGAIKHKVGKILQRKSRITARAINPEAISRKEEGRLDIEAEFRMLPIDMKIQDNIGIGMISEDRPKTRDETDTAKKNYREKGELIYDRILRYHNRVSEMDHERLLMYEASQVAGITHAYVHADRGFPEVDRLEPDMVLLDADSNDPLFTDAKFVVVMKYEPIENIAMKYEMRESDLEKLYSYSNNSGYGSMRPVQAIPGLEGVNTLRTIGGTSHALVVKAFWYDVEKRRLVESKGKNGYTHVHDEEDTKKPRKGRDVVVRYDRQQVRYCTVIAGEFIPQEGWGKYKNAYREYGDPMKTRLPVVSWAPNWRNGKLTSTVQELIPLQAMIDRCWMMVDKAMRNDRGKILANDVSQVPKGMTHEQQMNTAEIRGYFPYNGSDYITPGNYRQLISLDLSLPPAVVTYLEIASRAQLQIDGMIGLTQSEKGEANIPGQKVGTVRSSIQQSSVQHRFETNMWDRFEARVAEQVLDLFRPIILEDKERYAHVIGDDGVQWLSRKKNFDTEDYGIDIEADDLDQDRVATIQQTIANAIQGNPSLIVSGIEMLVEDNYRSSLEKLREVLSKQKNEAQQAQRTQMMMEQQARQSEMQARDQQVQQQRQADMQKVQMMEEMRAMREERIKNQDIMGKFYITQEQGKQALDQARMREAAEYTKLNREYDRREDIESLKSETDIQIARMNRANRESNNM